MKQTTKDKIYMALALLGMAAVWIIIIEAVRVFMWACYYTGIPM